MTDKEKAQGVKTDNELIAEFMGFTCIMELVGVDGKTERTYKNVEVLGLLSPYFGGHRTPHLQFDSSWDWLIPVVEKIETICMEGEYWIVEIGKMNSGSNRYCRIRINHIPYPVSLGIEATHIKAVYVAVVQFIKWYNSLNQTNP